MKRIPKTQGYYASADGRIWTTLVHSGRNKRHNDSSALREKKTHLDPDGYKIVGILHTDGKYRTRRISVLVLETYRGSRPGHDYDACHKNGNRDDDRACNLYWGTKKQNHQDAVRHGTKGSGDANSNCKIRFKDICRLFELRKRGWTQTRIAENVGLSQTYVGKILNRKRRTIV